MAISSLSTDQQIALANEVRLQAAALHSATLQGQVTAFGNAAQVLSSLSQDAAKQLAVASQALAALQVGIGPGITADFGAYTSIDQLLKTERNAGITAAVLYIQANPTCAEDQAVTAWTTAAIAATGLSACIIPPLNLLPLYAGNAVAEKLIPDASFASLAAWIVATPTTTIATIMAG